jgi:pimeloyl-ACP methyl ester carboxylesterase
MAQTMKVPGATIHYEVRGSGPVLLLISGGPTDADVYAGLAGCLARGYTVVTYEPRGNSRSSLDGPEAPWRLDLLADDAARLLDTVADGPAQVFGNSGGAVVGLELCARHPGKVQTLVAHEPPLVALLPDAAAHLARGEAIQETYRRQGVGPAMQMFLAGAGLEARPPVPASGAGAEPTPEMREAMARLGRNLVLFLERGLREIGTVAPDLAALRASPTRIVVAAGETSGQQLASRCAAALADRLALPVVRFPGDHGGFMSDPEAFARALRATLESGAARGAGDRRAS